MQFRSTVDVKVIQEMGGDHMVVAAARVSTSGAAAMRFAPGMSRYVTDDEREQREAEKRQIAEENAGLINYLMKHRHGTPFEHSAVTFFIRAPIFVWREFHRHRIGFSYNEESARYKPLEPVFYIPDRDRLMMKVDDWKPGKPKFMPCDSDVKFQKLISNLKSSCAYAYEQYLDNLEMGFDPGLARACLPVGIYSSCWVTCNPRSLMAFLSLRTHDPDALFVSYPLHEIEMVARACEEVLKDGWPLTYDAFLRNGRMGP